MDINVHPEGETVTPFVQQPAAQIKPDSAEEGAVNPHSLLAGLAAKRDEVRRELTRTWKIPRWEETMSMAAFATFRPVSSVYISQRMEYRGKQKATNPDWELLANADILVNACVSVHVVMDGATYPLRKDGKDDLTKFDANLGEVLGVTDGLATSACRAFYLTDGDLLSAALQLVDWSTQAGEQVDKDFSKP